MLWPSGGYSRPSGREPSTFAARRAATGGHGTGAFSMRKIRASPQNGFDCPCGFHLNHNHKGYPIVHSKRKHAHQFGYLGECVVPVGSNKAFREAFALNEIRTLQKEGLLGRGGAGFEGTILERFKGKPTSSFLLGGCSKR